VLRVFSNPVKILLLGLFLRSQNSKSSFLLCLSAHLLNAHLAEYLLTELPAVLSPPVHPMHLLNALLAELSESLVILTSSELTTEFFLSTLCLCSMPSWQSFTELTTEFLSSVHSLHLLNALLAELYRTQREIMSATVFFSTAFPPEVFSNLQGLLLS
jgi:hypothetical protein